MYTFFPIHKLHYNVSNKEKSEIRILSITILRKDVEKRKDIIFSKQNSIVTNQAKNGNVT